MIVTEIQLPADPLTANKLVTHGASTIPETFFYFKILLGATALISCFPSGIRAKRRVKNVEEATKLNILHFKAVMSHIFRHSPFLIKCYKDACVLQKCSYCVRLSSNHVQGHNNSGTISQQEPKTAYITSDCTLLFCLNF